MSVYDYINPTTPKGVMGLAVLIMGLLVGMPMMLNVTTPNELQEYDTGFAALQGYMSADNPMEHTGDLLQFFFIPLLVVWTLVYAVLDGGVGRMFSQKLMAPLAMVFAFSTLFSGWFITLAAFINFFGSTGLIIFALIGLGIGALMTAEEWSVMRQGSTANIHRNEEKLEEKVTEIDDKMFGKLKESKRPIGDRFYTMIEHMIEMDLDNYDTPKDVGEGDDWDMRRVWGQIENNYAPSEAGPPDEELYELAKEKLDLGKKYAKYERREEKDLQEEIKEEREQLNR